MKILTAATQSHLAKDVTSLAACWRITRSDGVVHRFTDLDRDVRFSASHSLTVSIAAGESFIAVGAFSRSAIETKSGLRIDNLDLTGLVNADGQPGGIYLQDLEARRFNDAEVEVFLVNWQAPDDGVVPLMHGHLGEVTIDRDAGTYTAELRGLSQRAVRKVGQLFAPKCRADLFDARCGLSAADFTQRVVVQSVTSNKEFTVPALKSLADPEPSLDSGLRTSAAAASDGRLKLRRGPVELGTRDAPFLVSTPAELDAIRDNLFAWYALTQDVDMSAFGFFTPIPNFRGGLDGRGHEIVDLDVDRPGNAQPDGEAALFGRLLQGAVVRRLGIRGGRFQSGDSANYFAAPLAARTDASDQVGEFGVVEDCYSIGCQVLTDATTAPDRMTGLVGDLRGLRHLRRCVAASVVWGSAVSRNWGSRVGNLVGETDGSPPQAQSSLYSDDERQGVGQVPSATLQVDRYGVGEDSGAVARVTSAQAGVSNNFPGLDFDATWEPPEDQATVAMVASTSPAETVSFSAGSPSTIDRDVGSWIDDGFRPGDRVLISGAGAAIQTVPTSVSFSSGSATTLDRLTVGGVNLVSLGVTTGMRCVISGAAAYDGSRRVHLLVGTTNLDFAPGVVFQAATISGSQVTLTFTNDGYYDVVAATDSQLSLHPAWVVVPQAGLDASAVSISVARMPRLRVQRAP